MPVRPTNEETIKKSLSFPAPLYARARQRIIDYGFGSDSAYFQFLVRQDVIKGEQMTMQADPNASSLTPRNDRVTRHAAAAKAEAKPRKKK